MKGCTSKRVRVELARDVIRGTSRIAVYKNNAKIRSKQKQAKND